MTLGKAVFFSWGNPYRRLTAEDHLPAAFPEAGEMSQWLPQSTPCVPQSLHTFQKQLPMRLSSWGKFGKGRLVGQAGVLTAAAGHGATTNTGCLPPLLYVLDPLTLSYQLFWSQWFTWHDPDPFFWGLSTAYHALLWPELLQLVNSIYHQNWSRSTKGHPSGSPGLHRYSNQPYLLLMIRVNFPFKNGDSLSCWLVPGH